jgi:ketosteroid isomerase-like protein
VRAIAALVVLAACRGGAVATGPATADAAVEAWIQGFLGGDVDAMVRCYAPTPDVRIEHSTGDVDIGITAVRDEYRAAFAEVRFERVEFVPAAAAAPVGERANVDIATRSGRFRAWTRTSAGVQWLLEIHTALTLQRDANGWRIVREHSEPIPGVPRLRRVGG